MLESLDATAVRRWCAAGLDALRRHQVEIDELNVYPVPDGDTGTNLVLTVTSAWRALDEEDVAPGHPERVVRRMARGALLGARGNSGVIVSQILRGVADALVDVPSARGRALAEALASAARAAYTAVAEPVEGTVLSVASAAAAAAKATDTDDLAAVVRAAAEGAAKALAHTPEQLPALARAGVVDAGGRGLVVLLDALVEVVTGEARVEPPGPPPRRRRGLTVARETGSPEYGYEVQYLLDAPEESVERLKVALAGLGDSLVVVGTGSMAGEVSTWNVHVHVNDVGAVLEAGVEAGRPHRISVTRFEDQMAAPALDAHARGVVVVARGIGLIELFSAEGAVVVDGGPTHNPSTGEVLGAIRSTGAGQVALLPNDSNVHAVAAAAAEQARSSGIQVGVIPTRSPVQALAAMAVRDPSRRFHDDVIAMAEAAGACRWAEVTVATREALTVAGRCRPGDVLALVEGEVNVIETDLGRACVTLLDRMLGGGGEMVTLILGADAPASLGDDLTGHLREQWPFVDVHAYRGRQPHYPLLVGVE